MTILAIKKKIKDWLSENDTETFGGALFTDIQNGQILLFNKFGVCQQNNLTLKSDITQHYTEDNLFVNDHWAVASPQYMISGLIGELIYTRPTSWSAKVESLYSKTGLDTLSKLSPLLSNYTLSVLNIVTKVNSVYDKYTKIAKQTFKDWNNSNNDITNQRRILDELEKIMNNRILVNIYTPYGMYYNMAIVSINIRQNPNSKYMSDIEITFQKWRTPNEPFGKGDEPKQTSEVAEAQKSKELDKGLVGENNSDISIEDLDGN